MHRRVIAIAAALLALTFAADTAAAQQGPGTYQPGSYQPPPVPQLQLTHDEWRLLGQGEISTAAHVGGGLLGTFVGYGLGHMVQGRYGEKGWIFTVGEIGSVGALIYGVTSCAVADSQRGGQQTCHIGMLIGGMVGYVGFRIWEAIDVWAAPAEHNRKVRALRYRLQYHQPTIYVSKNDSHKTAGLRIRF